MSERDITLRLRRAVKENNLALVKRLIQRTDIRNPDPGPSRYTSLAWASVCGHENTFEYLLQMGHDDEELSKDAENNTILILLSGTRGSLLSSPVRPSPDDTELQNAAMRMARLYWERFPFIIDWANVQGKTALHVASLRGNEGFVRVLCDLGADLDLADGQGNTPLHYASAWGHIPVVQLLIERGCGFTAKNNEGFTASDYAFSNNTQEALQETARTRWETNKKSRVVARQAAKKAERSGYDLAELNQAEDLPRRGLGVAGMRRLRSGSGTTSASDSTDYEGPLSTSAPGSSQFSGHSSSGSLPRAPPSNGTVLTPIMAGSNEGRARNTSTSSTTAPTHSSRPSVSSTTTSARSGSQAPQGLVRTTSGKVILSPIATRMLERDAGAIAEYMKRTRSGSNSSTNTLDMASANPPAANAKPYPQPPPSSEAPSDPRSNNVSRSLRPSLSAASLRGSSSLLASSTAPTTPAANSRIRAGTLNNVLGTTSGTTTPKTPPTGSNSILQTLKRPVFAVLPVGRASEASHTTNGHSRRPSGSLFRDLTSMRTDSS